MAKEKHPEIDLDDPQKSQQDVDPEGKSEEADTALGAVPESPGEDATEADQGSAVEPESPEEDGSVAEEAGETAALQEDDAVAVAKTPDEEPTEAKTQTPGPAPAVPAKPASGGGFFPLVLGGLVAAGVGYGAAAVSSGKIWPFDNGAEAAFQTETRQTLDGQATRLQGLDDRIAKVESSLAAIDLSGVEQGLAAVRNDVDTIASAQSDLGARLDALAERLDALERRPVEQAVSPEAIQAYERALDGLRAEIDAQREEVAAMAEKAVVAQQNASEKARLAAVRTAFGALSNAVASGQGYSNELAKLRQYGVSVPDVLARNADAGVPGLSALIAEFPPAARKALAAARSVETDKTTGGNRVLTFLKNQLGARSVAPREGDDPDAVLSRAEAATRNGDLEAALAELSALPEVAQAEMSAWRQRAQTTLDVRAALDAVSQQLVQE